MEDNFVRAYKSLNKAQKDAVDLIEGPVMVIAGPGTGKTTVLTLRIANILKQTDTPAHGILAITYTDAGVKAMRTKLRDLIGTRAHEVEIHTFHSFAKMVMNEYPDHFIELSGLKQMTDVESEMLVKNILEDEEFRVLRPAGKPDAYLSQILRAIDNVKRDAITPKEVRKFAEEEIKRIESDEDSISTRGKTKGKLKAEAEERIEKSKKTILFAKVYERYEEAKKKLKKLDFSDLIIELLIKMREDELLLRLLQERFLYLHVDEHQDTNDAQNFIVGLLGEFFDTPNIFIVGDEKQAIYRFQGASVENFLLLRKRWPDMRLISLDQNYRSHQSILDSSFSVIEKNYDEGEHNDLRVKLVSALNETERPIELVSAEDVYTMEDYLLKSLKEILSNHKDKTVAIITRRNRDLERVIELLESNSIPVSSERSVDIFHHPVGSTFFSLIDFVFDNTRVESLGRTLTMGLWGLDLNQGVLALRDLRAGRPMSTQLVDKINEIKKAELSNGPIEFLTTLSHITGFDGLVTRDPSYVHVWRGIISLSESLARDSRIEDPRVLIENLLAYKDSAERKAVKVSVGAPDLPVKAMTAHSSKGLEFDYVFIPYATEESWVGRNHGNSFVLPLKSVVDGDTKDIRRLFYVALTRARSHVVVLTPLEESDGKVLTPLRFVSEIEAGSENVSLPRIERRINKITQSKSDKEGDKLLSITKDALIKNGLSVTALNHFLECPNKFIYESVLKMPQAPSVVSTKGTAMHEAISHVWMMEDRQNLSQNELEKIILEITERSVDDTLLSKRDKNLVKLEISEDVSVVAKELLEHLRQMGTIYTEKWLEHPFNLSDIEEKLYIPIHGKLDALVDNGKEVKIFDYKTKQAMSVNEIKGETKNSNGDYFRQLVFYRILAESDPKWKMRKIETSLVFVRPDKLGRCPTITLEVTKEDKDKVRSEVRSLIESVWTKKILQETCGKKDCEYCALRSLLS